MAVLDLPELILSAVHGTVDLHSLELPRRPVWDVEARGHVGDVQEDELASRRPPRRFLNIFCSDVELAPRLVRSPGGGDSIETFLA